MSVNLGTQAVCQFREYGSGTLLKAELPLEIRLVTVKSSNTGNSARKPTSELPQGWNQGNSTPHFPIQWVRELGLGSSGSLTPF